MTRVRMRTLGLIAAGALVGMSAPAALASGVTTFSSPSGNIGCALFSAEGHVIARCDIGDREWPAPKKPASCHLDYGNGVYVSAVGGRARYECAGDTALGPKRILDYGDSLSRGPIKCLSLTTGMRCNDTRDGHGFLISRETVKLY